MKPILNAFTRPSLATTLYLVAAAYLQGEVPEFGIGLLVGREEDRWDPETVWHELRDDTDGKLLPQNFSKLMAAVEAVTSNSYDVSLSDFARLCNILSDSPTDGSFDPAELHEVAWGLTEISILTGESPDPSPEVLAYIQDTMNRNGMSSMPNSLAAILGDRAIAPRYTNSDDPELFSMVQGAADRKAEEVDAFVTERLQRLDAEVARVGLQPPGWLSGVFEKIHNESDSGDSPV